MQSTQKVGGGVDALMAGVIPFDPCQDRFVNCAVVHVNIKKMYDADFKNRCVQLETFKNSFGHFRVPQRYPSNQPLANWCNNTRTSIK